MSGGLVYDGDPLDFIFPIPVSALFRECQSNIFVLVSYTLENLTDPLSWF